QQGVVQQWELFVECRRRNDLSAVSGCARDGALFTHGIPEASALQSPPKAKGRASYEERPARDPMCRLELLGVFDSRAHGAIGLDTDDGHAAIGAIEARGDAALGVHAGNGRTEFEPQPD